jgi:hypothetical protein
MTRKVLLALMLIGLTQNGYCGWKDALKEVAKQVVDQSIQAQPQQPSAQQASTGSDDAASQKKTAEQLQKEEKDRQRMLLTEQKYPHNWLTQFRMVQYGFKPRENDELLSKIITLENYVLKFVTVSEKGDAKIGNTISGEELRGIFGVDANDESHLKEFLAWLQYRFKPVFLKHCTTLYQLTKSKDLASIDALPNQQKLDYLSKVHFPMEGSSPYLAESSPFKGKALQVNALDVETAYQGYQGNGKDETALAKAAGLVQEKALAKKQKEERVRKLEALSRKSGKPDVAVSIGANQFHGTLTFDIQSITDKATIWKVSVNRGNCSLPEGTAADIEKTVTLGFGQTYRGYSNNCKMQNVREIEVTTENGRFVFNF